MQRRAYEGATKSNMHTLQMTIEDYALQNDGGYPTSATSALTDGRKLADVCPTGNYPINPYTKLPSVVMWNSDPRPGTRASWRSTRRSRPTTWSRATTPGATRSGLTLTSGQ